MLKNENDKNIRVSNEIEKLIWTQNHINKRIHPTLEFGFIIKTCPKPMLIKVLQMAHVEQIKAFTVIIKCE
jgi:hypothetical protein